jgi:hypothetical protein
MRRHRFGRRRSTSRPRRGPPAFGADDAFDHESRGVRSSRARVEVERLADSRGGPSALSYARSPTSLHGPWDIDPRRWRLALRTHADRSTPLVGSLDCIHRFPRRCAADPVVRSIALGSRARRSRLPPEADVFITAGTSLHHPRRLPSSLEAMAIIARAPHVIDPTEPRSRTEALRVGTRIDRPLHLTHRGSPTAHPTVTTTSTGDRHPCRPR